MNTSQLDMRHLTTMKLVDCAIQSLKKEVLSGQALLSPLKHLTNTLLAFKSVVKQFEHPALFPPLKNLCL
ncbi:hypothetical protein DBR09_10580 [Aeromonas sp. HMWF016]|nr:hypothetical protein DBR09_10580 [Aeromonas sp. HMWF016]